MEALAVLLQEAENRYQNNDEPRRAPAVGAPAGHPPTPADSSAAPAQSNPAAGPPTPAGMPRRALQNKHRHPGQMLGGAAEQRAMRSAFCLPDGGSALSTHPFWPCPALAGWRLHP